MMNSSTPNFYPTLQKQLFKIIYFNPIMIITNILGKMVLPPKLDLSFLDNT